MQGNRPSTDPGDGGMRGERIGGGGGGERDREREKEGTGTHPQINPHRGDGK